MTEASGAGGKGLDSGRSSAVYVPAVARREARQGVAAWTWFWELAVQMAAHNRDAAVARWRAVRSRARRTHAATRS